MDTRNVTARPNVSVATSAPRPTPTPYRVRFGEILGRSLVRGAEGALRALPGGPMMAVAVRGGSAGVPMTTPMSSPLVPPPPLGLAPPGPGRVLAGPEGPAPAGGGGSVAGEAGSIEASLAQSQEMNLYYLQIQEEVNAQNRSFTALSNVLKAEHDTVKTAIGNIR
jgi:hypothetical protein